MDLYFYDKNATFFAFNQHQKSHLIPRQYIKYLTSNKGRLKNTYFPNIFADHKNKYDP